MAECMGTIMLATCTTNNHALHSLRLDEAILRQGQYCLELGHETLVCGVCLYILIGSGYVLLPDWQQAIAWTNVDLSSMTSCGIDLGVISLEWSIYISLKITTASHMG